MDKETMNQVFSYVDALAQKLGVAANHIMEVYMKQQYVEAITNLLMLVILYITGYVVIFKVYPKIRKNYEEGPKQAFHGFWDTTPGVMIGIAMTVIGILLVIVTAILPSDIIGKFINPEYYAIQSIFEAFSGNK